MVSHGPIEKHEGADELAPAAALVGQLTGQGISRYWDGGGLIRSITITPPLQALPVPSKDTPTDSGGGGFRSPPRKILAEPSTPLLRIHQERCG